jgi:hypothetical protein
MALAPSVMNADPRKGDIFVENALSQNRVRQGKSNRSIKTGQDKKAMHLEVNAKSWSNLTPHD